MIIYLYYLYLYIYIIFILFILLFESRNFLSMRIDWKLSVSLLDRSTVASDNSADVVSSGHRVRLGINSDRRRDRLQGASEFVASGKNQPREASVNFSREAKRTFPPHCRSWTYGDPRSASTKPKFTYRDVSRFDEGAGWSLFRLWRGNARLDLFFRSYMNKWSSGDAKNIYCELIAM